MDNKFIIDCLSNIKDYCQLANNFVIEEDLSVEDLSVEDFNGRMPIYVLTMILVQIGEEVKNIPEEFKSINNKVPWKDISGMEDVILNNFNEVKKDEVFNTVVNDLPVLLQYCEFLINKLENEEVGFNWD